LAKKNGTDFVVYGSGRPLRQFIYSKDLARLFLWVLHHYDSPQPLILSVGEEDEVSIKDVVERIVDAFQFKGNVVYDTSKADGQFKKTASNKKLKSLYPDLKFTSLDVAIKTTVNWFQENYDTARK